MEKNKEVNSIIDTIDMLGRSDFYKAGETTEIAKGKNEMDPTWKGLKRKVKRVINNR